MSFARVNTFFLDRMTNKLTFLNSLKIQSLGNKYTQLLILLPNYSTEWYFQTLSDFITGNFLEVLNIGF